MLIQVLAFVVDLEFAMKARNTTVLGNSRLQDELMGINGTLKRCYQEHHCQLDDQAFDTRVRSQKMYSIVITQSLMMVVPFLVREDTSGEFQRRFFLVYRSFVEPVKRSKNVLTRRERSS